MAQKLNKCKVRNKRNDQLIYSSPDSGATTASSSGAVSYSNNAGTIAYRGYPPSDKLTHRSVKNIAKLIRIVNCVNS